VPADIARLTIPPGADTAAALTRLDEHAERGNVPAAWARLHYLLDVFDDARFRDDADSRRILATALGRGDEELRGAKATNAALARLLVEADRVLAAKRLHSGAQAARTLIEFDAKPPGERGAVFQRMVELKTVAAGGGPLQHNARLRLFGFCNNAFGDALRAPRHARIRMISFCLYPLFSSDPEPYFAADPRQRPPAPHWRDLSSQMGALLASVKTGGARLAPAGAALAVEWKQRLEKNAAALPVPHTPAALGVPTVERAEPFDWTPLLAVGDGHAIASRESLIAQMKAALQFDERGTIAVGMYGQSRADSLYVVAGAAAAAGAHHLQLAVGYAQKLNAPEGDYWFGRTQDGIVSRVGVISLALATLPDAAGATASADPRALGWDPRRAALGLHVVVDADDWQLVAPSGVVARIATGMGDPRTGLRDALKKVRAAFPDEDGLILVIGGGATYAALISAATAAAYDADGRTFFSKLALAAAAPTPNKDTLTRRIDRRRRASVTLSPDALVKRASIARRCYQDLLEKSPKLAGEFRVELREGEPAITSGPRNKKLRACVLAGVAAPMKAKQLASATVTLAPR
jgi:hypothetical protein